MSFSSLRNVAFAATAALCLTSTFTTQPALAAPAGVQAPDNTRQNKASTATADNQTNSKADRETTAKIRKAIVGGKDLSTYAHNVKVISVNGQVTLKGPVQTEDEKQKIASLAASVVPPEKIVNELTVKQ